MKKILVVVGAAGVAAAIALGSRDQLQDVAVEETSETSIVTAAEARPAARVPNVLEEAADSGVEANASSSTASGTATAPSQSARGGQAAAPAAENSGAAAAQAGDSVSAAAANTSPQTDAILRRAAAAYAKVRSMQASFTQQLDNPLIGTHISSAGTLYQRKPDRLLLKFSKPAGDLLLSDGRYFWVFYPSVDAKQVIRAPASAAGQGGVDLQAQFLGDPVRRFRSTLNGREQVAGRPAHVLTMVPREATGYKQLKVWIDEKDALARRFEIIEENGNVRRFELRDVLINPAIAEGVFKFTPPAGARVIDR